MSAQCPVAIVGIGCRLPGGSDTKELYDEFLRKKVSIQTIQRKYSSYLCDRRAMGCLNLLLIDGTIMNGEVVRHLSLLASCH